jgi:hypothetical protein
LERTLPGTHKTSGAASGARSGTIGGGRQQIQVSNSKVRQNALLNTESSINEGAVKELLACFIDCIDTSGEVPGWAIDDGDEVAVTAALNQILNSTSQFSSMDEHNKEGLLQAGLEHLGLA